jgi:hypothetical protein
MSLGCPPRPRARGLGGIHRFLRLILSHPPPPFHKEIHVLRIERPPLPVLCALLRPITSSEGLHSPHQIHQGAFPVGVGVARSHPPPVFCLRAYGKEDLYLFISCFSSLFGLSAAQRGKLALLFPVVF